ncbi:hypothetical protein BYT27DRAFT_7084474 [Phlegmacium glaucopus]|nr:hypothetical protein BYT27DRAFT_7084474 [Phlegmacium glaucopus]
MFHLPSTFSDYVSAFPYPPSSPSAGECSSLALRASVAAVPDSKLRAIMVKLAESSPQFHRAIVKELGYAQVTRESPPTTPTTPKTPKSEKRRSRPRRQHKTLTISTQTPNHNHKRHISTATEASFLSDCVYHPGNLEEEDYEFLSGSPGDMARKAVRTIMMWSCCKEDEWSPGCINATMIPAQFKVEHDDRYDANHSHDDVFPDSDLEGRPDLSSRLLSDTRWTTKYL